MNGYIEGDAAYLDVDVRIALRGPAGAFSLDVRLAARKGEFIALSGPSGAGKTTLLRLVAGLSRPDAGHIRVGGATWHDSASGARLAVQRRPIGFVFQDYALFPNMTVRGNVVYAVGAGRADVGREVDGLLDMVDLGGLSDVYPAQLSGGQKQRLALIRSLARKPDILMLDEPLSALDPEMRGRLQLELKRLHRLFGTTTLLVSHDVSEILRLADRVVRLEQGRVAFDGAPADAFGAGGEAGLLQTVGECVSGPDASGFCRIHVDGRLVKSRLREGSAPPRPGDRVLLRALDAEILPVEESHRSAGEITAFTSRGGA